VTHLLSSTLQVLLDTWSQCSYPLNGVPYSWYKAYQVWLEMGACISMWIPGPGKRQWKRQKRTKKHPGIHQWVRIGGGVVAAAVLFRTERSRGCEEVPGKGRTSHSLWGQVNGAGLVRMEGYWTEQKLVWIARSMHCIHQCVLCRGELRTWLMIERVLLPRWMLSSTVDGWSLVEEITVARGETVDSDANKQEVFNSADNYSSDRCIM